MWSQGPCLVNQIGPWKQTFNDKFKGYPTNARRRNVSTPYVAVFPAVSPPDPSTYASVVGQRDIIHEMITQKNSKFKAQRGGKGARFNVKSGLNPFIDSDLNLEEWENRMAFKENPQEIKDRIQLSNNRSALGKPDPLPVAMLDINDEEQLPDNEEFVIASEYTDDMESVDGKRSVKSMGSIIGNNQNTEETPLPKISSTSLVEKLSVENEENFKRNKLKFDKELKKIYNDLRKNPTKAKAIRFNELRELQKHFVKYRTTNSARKRVRETELFDFTNYEFEPKEKSLKLI